MTALLMSILKLIVATLAPVFASLLIYYTTKIGNKLLEKMGIEIDVKKNEKTSDVIWSAEKDIERAVAFIQQQYVDELKKKGQFNVDSQIEALSKATRLSCDFLSDEQKKIIKENYGDITDFVRATIEQTLNNKK